MADLHGIELILGLLFVVVALGVLAQRINLPYPMLLLVGGSVLALIPGLPRVELEPHLAFVLFLPPVLFAAAYFTSWRDFRANARPISLLALGCVLATTSAVAVVAHALFPDMSWATAFVIGAIVSPPDAVAATAIFQRLGAPHRAVTILEGESLVNDASALIAYRFAVAAVATGTFSLWDASLDFMVLCTGGVVFGLAMGWLMRWLTSLIDEPSMEIAFTLIAPLGIYVIAEQIHVSGVLATVAAGLYFGRHSHEALSTRARVGGVAVWNTGILLINGLVFILIGLQLGIILDELEDRDLTTLIGQSLLISLVVIVVRFLWVYPATYIPRWIVPGLADRDPAPPWQGPFLISWSGLRGVVSLASALALPFTVESGAPFLFRAEIIFIAFVVILVTLLGQGLALPWLMERLGQQDDGSVERETLEAQRLAASAAVARIDELKSAGWTPDGHAAELRHRFAHRLEQLDGEDPDHLDATERLRDEVIEAARVAVIAARDRGEIGDEARQRVEAELDLEALRTEH